MNASPRVSVVVTTHNRAEQLAELFGGLREQTVSKHDFEVVVVDDASRDSTASVIQTEIERAELDMTHLHRDRSGGAAVGREQGWRAASAPLVAFTDDDCLPAPDWLQEVLSSADDNPGAIVQGLTLPRPDQLDRLGPFARTMDVQALGPDYPTTNIVYPRELLELVGGFDTETYDQAVGGEDTDLAWRAISGGARSVLATRAKVFHAVNVLGPMGRLRVAARHTAVLPFGQHAGSRAHFVHGVFRKRTHLNLVLAFAGLATARRTRGAGILLAAPYALDLRARGRIEGGGNCLAPFFLVHDLVEVSATLRGAWQTRRPMI